MGEARPARRAGTHAGATTMQLMMIPQEEFEELLRDRRECGGDRYDEVWHGVYVMSPIADNDHQAIATELSAALLLALQLNVGRKVLAGTNVSDQDENWTKNFRCPDVAVFLPGCSAEDRGTHWFGGPDFAVEVISADDRSREKIDFYSQVGVRELLLVDRKPWRLELYRSGDGALRRVGVAALEPSGAVLVSEVLPVSFRLTPADPRPRIVVTQTADGRTWTI
jgi:Uma2 family endonuclease